jgi:hypothetical protein
MQGLVSKGKEKRKRGATERTDDDALDGKLRIFDMKENPSFYDERLQAEAASERARCEECVLCKEEKEKAEEVAAENAKELRRERHLV